MSKKADYRSKLRKKIYSQLGASYKKLGELLEEYAQMDEQHESLGGIERRKNLIWTVEDMTKFEDLLKTHGADVDTIAKHFPDKAKSAVKKRVDTYVKAGKAKRKRSDDSEKEEEEEEEEEEDDQ